MTTKRTAAALGLVLAILACQASRTATAGQKRAGSATARVDATKKQGSNSAKVTVRVTVKFKTPFELITRKETFKDLTVKKGSKPVKKSQSGNGVVYVLTVEWVGKNSVKVVVDMTSKYGKASTTRTVKIREAKDR
jgi:hypothetical protein